MAYDSPDTCPRWRRQCAGDVSRFGYISVSKFIAVRIPAVSDACRLNRTINRQLMLPNIFDSSTCQRSSDKHFWKISNFEIVSLARSLCFSWKISRHVRSLRCMMVDDPKSHRRVRIVQLSADFAVQTQTTTVVNVV